MAYALQPEPITVAEYLRRERDATTRHEFAGGVVYAMAGGSPAHSQIGTQIRTTLANALRDRECIVFDSDLKVRCQEIGPIFYPDASVACDPLTDEDCLLNPTILVEVLSPSTEQMDRGVKCLHYQRLSSLRVFLLVAQDQARVEAFARESADDAWTYRVAAGVDATLELPEVGLSLALAEIYRRTEFDPGR